MRSLIKLVVSTLWASAQLWAIKALFIGRWNSFFCGPQER